METAILGGGCFWCLEAVFERLKGVEAVESGYAGGSVENPTYHQVCRGDTGHAEVVRVSFDPSRISFADLLRVFFHLHDPTTLNRQGADVGTQYRSAVFYADEEQRDTTRKIIAEIEREGIWPGAVVTQVEPAGIFYPAEEYHRGYYRANPDQPYCRAVIDPKLRKLFEKFGPLAEGR